MIPEVFWEVMKTDPDILLQSDISTIDNNSKAKLIKALLQLHDEKKLTYSYFHILRYKNLSYPGLAEQLEPYICNPTKSIWTRYVAIDIAEACQAKDVQSSLVDLVLDPKQDYQLRVHAISAACHLCDEKTKLRLKPFAIDNIEHDPEDDLKGYALQAVYPNHVSTGEVLRSLKSLNKKSFGGSYQDFLAKIFVDLFELPDLLIALNWLELQPKIRDLHYPFDKLSDCILQKAWEHIEDPKILLSFAKIVFLRLQNHDVLVKSDYLEFKQTLIEDDNKRRRLINAVISILPESNRDPLFLIGGLVNDQYNQLSLLKQDFFWLFRSLQRTKSKHIQRVYAKLIRQILNWQDAESVSSIIKLDQYSSILKAEFPSELAPPIELGSARAKRAKAIYDKEQAFLSSLNRQNQHPLIEPPPKQRVLKILEKIEANQPELWWQLPMEMSLKPTSSHYHFCDKPDLTTFPAWIEAEMNTKERIIETAKIYLEVRQPETQKSLNINNYSNDEFAGYQALYLLLKQEPEFVSKIFSQTWTKWIPTILKYTNLCIRHIVQGNHDEGILKKAYEINPSKVIDTLIDFMYLNNYQPLTQHDHDIYCSAKDLIGKPLAKSILSKVNIEDLNPGMLEVLLKDLFVDANDEAKMLALSLICLPLPILGKARERSLVSARILLVNVDNFIWPTIWAAIEQDSSFGREVFEYIGRMILYDKSTSKLFQALNEKYLADLFIFLVEQYPEIEMDKDGITDNENKLVGVSWHTSKSNDEVRDWKRYIPQWLQERGTSEASEAFRKIIRELPELAVELQWRLLETEAAARRITWNPPQPEHILRLVLSQEPSNLDLSNKIDVINQRAEKMEDEPKIENNITISNSPNSPINVNAPIGTSGVTNSQVSSSAPNSRKGINWGIWLAAIAVLLAFIAIPLSMSVSGAFNEEFKQWIKRASPFKVKQQPTPTSK
jgi:hypothetical protein